MAKFKPTRSGKHSKGHGRPKKKFQPRELPPVIPVRRYPVPLKPKPASDIEAAIRILQALENLGYTVWGDD